MKTYEQLLDDVVTREYKRINPVAINIHKNVAKEYAKQWVKRALEEASEVDVTLLIEIEKEIDAQ